MSNYLGFTPTTSKEYYFISYNNEDAVKVGTIASALANAGVSLWYDYGLEYGEKWEPTIAKRIDESKAVILFFTKGILKKESSFVQKEFKMADKVYKKKIYVVLMDEINNTDVPYDKIGWWLDIQDLQCINAFAFSKTSDLLKTITKAIGEQTVNSKIPAKPDESPVLAKPEMSLEELKKAVSELSVRTDKSVAETDEYNPSKPVRKLQRTQAEMMKRGKEDENDDSLDFLGVKFKRDSFNSVVESWLDLNEKKSGECLNTKGANRNIQREGSKTEKINSDNLVEDSEPGGSRNKERARSYRCLVCGYVRNSFRDLYSTNSKCPICRSSRWEEIK